MKLVGRVFYGLLVAMLAFNIYGLSLFQMEYEAVDKYGSLAIEENDPSFFRNMFDYYEQEDLLHVLETKDSESDIAFQLYLFKGVSNKMDFVRVQLDSLEGFDYDKGFEISVLLEGQTEWKNYKFVAHDKFYYLNLALNNLLNEKEPSGFIDWIDFKINAIYTDEVDGKKVELEKLIYDFDQPMVLTKAQMDVADKLYTPIDPEAETPEYPTLESLLLVKSVKRNFFNEFSYILWRNMAIYAVGVVMLTYFVFFRKKLSMSKKIKNPVVFKENINIKVIDSVKEVDETKDKQK
ncbi:MAG: hypothetical protein RBQ91_06010 [Acholeplasma sp.]|nr:hypothetical protein [Acholeplasma sp.]